MASIEPEQQAAEHAPAAAEKRKRKRPTKKAGKEIDTRADNFVDTYTGQLCKRAIIIPGVPYACFTCIPVALRWITENVKDETVAADYKKTLLEAYEQTENNAVEAGDRRTLREFGGALTYLEYSAGFRHWETHAEQAGISVKEWKSAASGKKAAKKGKNGLAFEAGLYVVPSKGSACKRENQLDGQKLEKGQVTVAGARKKLATFAKAHADLKCTLVFASFEGYDVLFNATHEPVAPELVNKVAQKLLKDQEGVVVVGPAIALFTRKHNIAL